MKIGVVSEFYYPLWGGVSEHIRSVSNELKALGHEVVVVTSHQRGDGGDRGPRTVRLGRSLPIYYNNSLSRLSVGWRLGRRMREVLAKERFDLLHLHSPLQPTLTHLALRHARCPIVSTFHSYYPKDRLAEAFRVPLGRLIAKSKLRVAVSPAALKAAAPLFPGDYRIVPNGVDYDLFADAAAGGRAKLKGLDESKLRLLFVGAMVKRKGLPHLLEAFVDIAAERDDVELLVVGDGPERQAMQRSIGGDLGGRVHFVGSVVHRPTLARYYAACDVFCAPSLGRESFGMVLLEAMAAKLPIVCYDIEGYRDVVSQGVEGLLVERGNVAGLKDAVDYLLDNPDARRRYGEAGQAKAADLSWREIALRLDRIYHEALGLPVPEAEDARVAAVAGTA